MVALTALKRKNEHACFSEQREGHTYAQTGAVSVTVKFQVGKVVASAATGKNPESNPVIPLALSLRQGSSKADWVTVWFFS